MYSTENATPHISSWMQPQIHITSRLQNLKGYEALCSSTKYLSILRTVASGSKTLNTFGWLRHCIFMDGCVASEVSVRAHFHNKRLSLTALFVLPFCSHLAFRLSFPFNFFCQRREALTQGPCGIHRGWQSIKTKEKHGRRKKGPNKTASWTEDQCVLTSHRVCISCVSAASWLLGWGGNALNW